MDELMQDLFEQFENDVKEEESKKKEKTEEQIKEEKEKIEKIHASTEYVNKKTEERLEVTREFLTGFETDSNRRSYNDYFNSANRNKNKDRETIEERDRESHRHKYGYDDDDRREREKEREKESSRSSRGYYSYSNYYNGTAKENKEDKEKPYDEKLLEKTLKVVKETIDRANNQYEERVKNVIKDIGTDFGAEDNYDGLDIVEAQLRNKKIREYKESVKDKKSKLTKRKKKAIHKVRALSVLASIGHSFISALDFGEAISDEVEAEFLANAVAATIKDIRGDIDFGMFSSDNKNEKSKKEEEESWRDKRYRY